MKINKVKITNFKNIEEVEYFPNNTTAVLIGHNGKGKTAFKEALYAGITGDFPEDCIKKGESECSVEIVLNDGTNFKRIMCREKPNKVLVNGKTSNMKTLAEIISTKTGVTKQALQIIGSTDVLSSLKPSEFGAFVMGYIPEKLDFPTVINYIPGISRKAQDVLAAVLPPMPDTFGMEELNNAYSQLFEQRKVAKRDLVKITATTTSSQQKTPTRGLAVIEAELADVLRKEGMQQTQKTAISLYETAVENRQKAEKMLANLKVSIDSIKVEKPNPSELLAIEEEKKIVNKNIVDAKTTINTINSNIKIFKNTLANLDKPVCPISEKLICTTDKSTIKEELATLIEQNSQTIKTQEEILKLKETRLIELVNEEKGYRENEKRYQEKTILIKRFNEQAKNMPVIPEKPLSVAMIDYTESVKNLNEEKRQALAWEEYQKNLKKQEEIQQSVDIYEFLCSALNPKGTVVCNIINHYLGVFQSIANTTAFELRPGFEVKFVADAGVTYLVRTDTGREWQKFETLSSGEQMITLFVILDMLNQLTDAKLMFIDDLDKLDKEAFRELMLLIDNPSIQSRYDHILLGAVNHDSIIQELKQHSVDWIYPV
jgi:hypothetical protein